MLKTIELVDETGAPTEDLQDEIQTRLAKLGHAYSPREHRMHLLDMSATRTGVLVLVMVAPTATTPAVFLVGDVALLPVDEDPTVSWLSPDYHPGYRYSPSELRMLLETRLVGMGVESSALLVNRPLGIVFPIDGECARSVPSR